MLFAQTYNFDEEWRWVKFTTESGLPANEVVQVYETVDSAVWAVTPGGIAWFDGYQWISTYNHYRHQFWGGQTTIIGELKDTIVVTSRGGLYGCTKESSYTMMEKRAQYGMLSKNLMLMSDSANIKIMKNPAGVFFPSSFFTFNGSIVRLFFTGQGCLWASTGEALYHWKNNGWQPVIQFASRTLDIADIKETEHGTGVMYIKTPTILSGLYEWQEHSKPIKSISEKPDIIKTMDISSTGNVIVVYRNNQIRVRMNGVWQSASFTRHGINEIYSVKFRKNGDLWVGSGQGLFLFRASSQRWNTLQFPFPDLRNSINEIAPGSDSAIWLGTSDGVVMYDRNRKPKSIQSIGSVELSVITGVAEDREGNIWISSGSSFPGAFRWTKKKWEYFPISNDSPYIHKISKDRKGNLWFLGIAKNQKNPKQPGAFIYVGGKFFRWGKGEGLISGRVYSFAEDRTGSLWFGTWDGLSKWTPSEIMNDSSVHEEEPPDPRRGAWKHWTEKNLHHPIVFTLTVDSNNTILFGHGGNWLGKGLGYINAAGFIQYNTNNNFALDDIWTIITDRKGRTWVSTKGGVKCYSGTSTLMFREYNGLPLNDVWPIAVDNDNVYIGTQGKGLAILNMSEAAYMPRIVIGEQVNSIEGIFFPVKKYGFWGEPKPEHIEVLWWFTEKRFLWERFRWASYADDRISIPSHEYNQNNNPFLPLEKTIEVTTADLYGVYDENAQQVTLRIEPEFVFRPLFYIPVGGLALTLFVLLNIYFYRKHKDKLALIASESRFRSVVTTTSSAIFVYDETTILFVNPMAEKLTGRQFAELQTIPFHSLIHDEHRGIVKEFEEQWLSKTHVPRRFECKILDNQQREHWIDVTAAKIMFQGKPATLLTAFDISEKKKAEESLRDREERFRIITEIISDYAYLDRVEEDGKWTILWITDSFSRLTGYTLADAQSPDFVMRYIHPDDLQENIEFMQQLMNGNSIHHTGRVITKNGNVLWLEHEARPVWDSAKGRVTYIYGAARNITERKNAEEALRESEERYRLVTELMSDYAYLDRVEPDGAFIPIWLTESFTKLTGYTTAESQTYDFIEKFVHPDDIPIIINGIQQTLQGKKVSYEVRVFKKDGAMRWLYNEVSPIWDEAQKRVAYMYGAAQDVTEQKKADDELKESEQRFRIITEMISDYAYLDRIEEDGSRTVLWNTASFTTLTGYSLEEAQAPDFFSNFIHPDDAAEMGQAMQQLIEGKSVSLTVRVVTKNGGVLWMFYKGKPIWDEKLNRVTFVYGAAHNITEEKTKQIELHRLSSELAITGQRERRRLAQFLHDVIGQTLAVVKLKIQMLEDTTIAHTDSKKEMNDIFKLVEETIANTRTATFELCPPVLYEFGIVAAIEWLVQKLKEQRSFAVTMRNSITQCSLKEEVSGILFNCARETLLNIVKHAKATKVNITLSRTEETLSLSISDDGVGFNSDALQERAKSVMGFGLYNLRQQISYIGGSLDIISEPGKGTTVNISAPIGVAGS